MKITTYLTKFIYWCEVFSENTLIKQEYFSANKELNFLFDKKFSAYLPSDFISQWARTVKPGLMILIQYFLLMASPSLALISLHVSAGSSGMEPRGTGRKICLINKMHYPLAMNVCEVLV